MPMLHKYCLKAAIFQGTLQEMRIRQATKRRGGVARKLLVVPDQLGVSQQGGLCQLIDPKIVGSRHPISMFEHHKICETTNDLKRPI